MQDAGNLFWVDLEMTGLEIESCSILEIASIVTDAQLNVLAQGPDLVIHHDDAVLAGMDEWNTTHHGESGLTEASRRSTVTMAEAERQTLEFAASWTLPRTAPLCGNSIHNDRKFIEKYMPALAAHLHYRNVDCSTLKELVRRWYGDEALMPKSRAHRAVGDILESIAELRHYRTHFFK